MVPSQTASDFISGGYSGSTENFETFGGSSYNGIPVSFDENDDLEADQVNKKGWKAEMIKLIEDIRQNITELQEGINFWSLEYFKQVQSINF